MLNSFIQHLLHTSRGYFATEWTKVITLVKDSFDIVQIMNSSSSSSSDVDVTADADAHRDRQLESLIQLLELCLFGDTFQLSFDPRGSGPLCEMLLELIIIQKKRQKEKENNRHQSFAQKEKIRKLASVLLSLPIGERSLRKIFFMTITTNEEDSMIDSNNKNNNDNHNNTHDIAFAHHPELFTKLTAAIAFSKEESRSWPLRTVVMSGGPGGAGGGGGGRMMKVDHLAWLRVLTRRLENPLCLKDIPMFRASVMVVLRQMLVESPQSESFHFAAFLVTAFFSELSTITTTTTSSSSMMSLEVMLCQLEKSISVIISGEDSNATSPFVLNSKVVSLCPILSSMYELVSAAIQQQKQKQQQQQSFSESIIERLKQTTKQLCKQIQEDDVDDDDDEEGDESDSDDENKQEQQTSKKMGFIKKNRWDHSISFSWLLNLWIGIAASFLFSSSTTQSNNNNNNNNGGNDEKRVAAILNDIKKHFRLPGKTAATLSDSSSSAVDSQFFSQWAVNEQLLFGESLLHPDIFKQATSAAMMKVDPTGAPILIRSAAELFRSQRAEGAAGTVLERAVEKNSSFSVGNNNDGGTPFGVDAALWNIFGDSVMDQNSSFSLCEQIDQRRRQSVYNSALAMNHHAPVEEFSRRTSQTPSDFYLWNLKQLSLSGGLVVHSSGASSGGDVAWAHVMKDVETARRSSILTGESGNGASLPTRLPMQGVSGFPSLQETGANPTRLPLNSSLTSQASSSSCSSSTIIQPQFILQQITRNDNEADLSNAGASPLNLLVGSWQKLSSMPENPYPAQPDTAPAQLNDIAGPQRYRPPQRFVLDKNTAARIEREKAEVKRRSRRELLQSLANEALGIVMTSPAETVKLLETLPEFLLRLTKSSIVAQTTMMQTELEESLTATGHSNSSVHSSKYVGGFRVPTTAWLMESLIRGK